MTIDQYKTEDGYEIDGCFYEDMESLIQEGLLGFCGCDCPDLNLEYILKGLEMIMTKKTKLMIIKHNSILEIMPQRDFSIIGPIVRA